MSASSVIDLAILELTHAEIKTHLPRFYGQSQLHDHALVCGFPNYRNGDQGVFSPGSLLERASSQV